MMIENSIMVIFQSLSFMLPLGWLCFKLFPDKKVRDNHKIVASYENAISELHKMAIVTLLGLSLLVFLTIDVKSAIFCFSVVINAALRSTIKQATNVIKSILPVQITGCLVALCFHFLLLGQPNNVALFTVLLLITTSVIYYYSYSKELRHKDIPNFEMSFLSAILIPLTLYTPSSGFHIEPFVRRAIDMMFIWLILIFILRVIVWSMFCRRSKSDMST